MFKALRHLEFVQEVRNTPKSSSSSKHKGIYSNRFYSDEFEFKRTRSVDAPKGENSKSYFFDLIQP